mgnify:CR=1 FL=1
MSQHSICEQNSQIRHKGTTERIKPQHIGSNINKQPHHKRDQQQKQFVYIGRQHQNKQYKQEWRKHTCNGNIVNNNNL